MENILISVVVPVFNVEKYLSVCLDSILKQSILSIEIICVNDCSTDQSGRILKKYAEKDSRIKIIDHDHNLGLGEARNTGIDNAVGVYIYFIDSDDLLFDENALNILYCTAEKNNADMVIGNSWAFDNDDDEQLFPMYFNDILKIDRSNESLHSFPELLRMNNVWNRLLKKSFLDEHEIRHIPPRFAEDIPFSMSLNQHAKTVSVVSDVTLKYRRGNFFGKATYQKCADAFYNMKRRFLIIEDSSFPENVTAVSRDIFLNYIIDMGVRQDIANMTIVDRIDILKDSVQTISKFLKLSDIQFVDKWKESFFARLFEGEYYEALCLLNTNYYYFKAKYKRKLNIGIFEHAMTRAKGGMEKVAADLASAMIERGHSVNIYTDNVREDARCVFSINSKVKIHNIDIAGKLGPKLLLDAVLDSDLDIFIFIYSGLGYFVALKEILNEIDIPIIYSEHSNPDFLYTAEGALEVRNGIIGEGAGIHVLLPRYSDSIPSNVNAKCKSILNPMNITRVDIKKTNNCYKIIYVGRIVSHAKNYKMLLGAFKSIAQNNPNWTLELYGHGHEVKTLLAYIQENGLQDRVFYRGTSNAMAEVYSSADLLCIPSIFEGLPLVVGEAQSCGLPVVGFKECSGVKDIVVDGETGILADCISETALAEALQKLMQNKELREDMGRKAILNARRFDTNFIFDDWESFILNCSTSKNRKIDECILNRLQEFKFWKYCGRAKDLEELNNTSVVIKRNLEIEKEQNLKSQTTSKAFTRTGPNQSSMINDYACLLNELYDSKSWKITRPLRWIADRIIGR